MVKKILFVFLGILILSLSIYQFKSQETKKTLNVYCYSSFSAMWGPGPKIKEEFEKKCNCKVTFFDAADSRSLIQRVLLQKASNPADIIIGIDQLDLKDLSEKIKLKKLDLPSAFSFLPAGQTIAFSDGAYPFDWGVLAFNKSLKKEYGVPVQIDDLIQADFTGKYILQDPRTSSPGLQMITWILRTKGEELGWKFIESLVQNAHSVAPSWSASYGLFDKGIVDIVYSYVTSPLYHRIEEKKLKSEVFTLGDRWPLQVEFFAVPQECNSCELAEDFANYLIGAEAQDVIMKKNYMFPVNLEVLKGSQFESAVPTSFEVYNITQDEKERWLKKWGEVRKGGSN